MPEVIRTIAARLRRFVADRRSAKRFAVRLRCTVGLASGRAIKNGGRADTSLEGFTYDVSETGLRLLMRAIHIDGHYLTGSGTTLLVLVELPDAPILLRAVAVRYDRLDEDDSQMSYLIGMQIKEMNNQDRERFVEYLSHR
jgi:hypothetical protein